MTFQEACAAVCSPGSMFEIQETDVLGLPTKVFAGTPPNIRALFELAALRTDEFIIFEEERWTMPQVLEMAGKIGHLLVNDLGVQHGDRVAIAMRNYPEWIASFAAITSIGAVAVPMNAWWVTEELEFAIADSGSKVVLADVERLQRMQGSAPGAITATIAVVRAEQAVTDGVIDLDKALADLGAVTMPDAEIAPDDDMTILYTSALAKRVVFARSLAYKISLCQFFLSTC